MAIELILQRTGSHAHVGIFLFPQVNKYVMCIKNKYQISFKTMKKNSKNQIFIKCTQNFYTLDKQSSYNKTYTP